MFHPCIEKLKDPAVLDRLRADTDGRCPRIWAEKTYAAFDLKTMPDLSYSLRMTFERTSAREPYEVPFFRRRHYLVACALLALLYPEKAEYLENLQEILWAICDEWSWAAPAHTNRAGLEGETCIDLFAADLGHAIAEILFLLEERMDPLVCERAKQEVQRRIIRSFEERSYWWETATMNWAVVCAGNVGAAMMFLDPAAFARQEERILSAVRCFLNAIPSDGVCLEGLTYWQYGFGNFVYFADLLYDFTEGKTDLFASERAEQTAGYPSRIWMTGDTFPSVSDCSPREFRMSGALARYLARRYPSVPTLPDRLLEFPQGNLAWNEMTRAAVWGERDREEDFSPAKEEYFPQAGQAIVRREKYSLFAKAGTNDEPHNHNDIGSFILATERGMALCDIGAGRYTGTYFVDETRYGILCNSSRGHSVPIVNGEYQKAGKEFFGTLEKEEGKIAIELSAAYGQQSVRRLHRTFTCEETAVLLTDEFEEGTEITERFVTFHCPNVTKDGVEIQDVVLRSKEGICPTVHTEEHELHGYVFDKNGGKRGSRTVYLIDFPIPRGKTSASFELLIRS